MIKSGGGINLAQGIPGFDPPNELLEVLRDKSMEPVHQYPPGNGQAKLVNLITDRYKGFRAANPDEVLDEEALGGYGGEHATPRAAYYRHSAGQRES